MAVIARGTDSSPTPLIPNLEFTRLHVTPFSPNLLNAIVPPSILPSVKNISYHSLQTFPEKSYGFLDLPKMDAEKIKKKLNGSILKGSKVRIEEARPSKESATTMDLDETTPKSQKEKVEKGSRKRKRHEEILPGVELRNRKVQRGWTTPAIESKKSDKRHKDKKDKKVIQAKSKFTSQPECLFKTSLPANIAANLKEDPSLSSLKGRKSRNNSGKEVVVHEFSKTTKHATFLRGSGVPAGSSAVSEYVEGKGWMDKDGNLVEAEIPKKKPSGLAVRNATANVGTDSSSAVSNTSEEDDSSEDEVQDSKKTTTTLAREASVTSSSGSLSEDENGVAESSSGSSSNSEDDVSQTSQPSEQQSRPTTASGPPPSLSLQIPKVETTPVQVHPLEALYKKPKTDNKASTSTPSFSFFGADSNEEVDTSQSEGQSLSIPMTPFTQQDFEFRGLRSAAPTPDTAHPGKTYTTWPSISTSNPNTTNADDEDEDDDDEDEDEAEISRVSRYAKSPIPDRSSGPSSSNKDIATGEEPPTSDFQKWFYEHRGETNRAWKKRRKVVSKEKRHQENKKRRD